jgi:molecular chaperone GrpE
VTARRGEEETHDRGPARIPVTGAGPVHSADDPVGGDAVEADPAQADPVEADAELGDELASVSRQRDDYLDALQRLKAEFDNFRKRAARERDELVGRASEQLVKQLLPVLDDLERALEAAAGHEEAKLEEGVRLVHRALSDLLAKEGLVEVETDGAFDPHTQEALLSQPSGEDEGTVIQVLQKGYRLGDRVLRPARVVVSAGGGPRGGGDA